LKNENRLHGLEAHVTDADLCISPVVRFSNPAISNRAHLVELESDRRNAALKNIQSRTVTPDAKPAK